MSETIRRLRPAGSSPGETTSIRRLEGDGVGAIEAALAAADGPTGWTFRFCGLEMISDTFLDTVDWRILRAGLALRFQRGPTPYFRLERAAGDDRPEDALRVDLETAPSDPASFAAWAVTGRLGERVRALAGERELVRHLDLRTRRAVYEGACESASARIVFDEIRIARRVGPAGPPARRMEIVVGSAGAASLESWIHARAAGAALGPAAALFETSSRLAGLALPTPPDLGSVDIQPSITIGAVAYACLRRHALAFLRHEAGTRLGEDPESLHDMRVAARRMRAAFALFAPFLPARAGGLRRELGRLGRVLGGVRDLDVQRAELAGWRAAASPQDAAAFDLLESRLVRRREVARRRLLAALDARRYERFLERLSAFLRRGPGRRPVAGRSPATEVAPALILESYRKFRKAGAALTPESAPAEFHRVRIRAKRLRYALEFLVPIYGAPARAMIEAMIALQDTLGEHQDAVVAIEHLRELAAGPRRALPPHALFVMGSLAERYAHRAEALRRAFPANFRKVRGRTWKRLRAALASAGGEVV